MSFSEILTIIGVIFSCALAWTIWFMSKKKSRTDYAAKLKTEHPYPEFQELYKKYLSSALDWLDERIGESLTWKAFSFHVGMALIYAIGLFAVSWAMGGSGSIGELEVFSNHIPVWQRLGLLALLGVSFLGVFKHQAVDHFIEAALTKKLPEKYARWAYRSFIAILMIVFAVWQGAYSVFLLSLVALYSPTAAVVGAFAFTVAGKFAVSVTFAIAFVLIAAVVGAFAFTSIFTFAVSVVGAGAFTAASTTLVSVEKKILRRFNFYSFSLIFLFLLGIHFEFSFLEPNRDLVTNLFFLVFLPYLNGVLDFISFWISRSLGRKILAAKHGWEAIQQISWDALAAFLLLSALVFGITFSVALFNLWIARQPELMVNLQELMQHAKEAPFGANGLWLTVMVFSTLLPTFLHLVMALIAFFTFYFFPRKFRLYIAGILESHPSNYKLTVPIFYATATYTLSILAPIFLLWLLISGFNEVFPTFASHLLDIAETGIAAAQWIAGK